MTDVAPGAPPPPTFGERLASALALARADVLAADAVFQRGDYRAARGAFLALASDPSLSPDDRFVVDARLVALRPDRVARAFGIITGVVVVFVYVLSRFVLSP